jgi:hypothetical protein
LSPRVGRLRRFYPRCFQIAGTNANFCPDAVGFRLSNGGLCSCTLFDRLLRRGERQNRSHSFLKFRDSATSLLLSIAAGFCFTILPRLRRSHNRRDLLCWILFQIEKGGQQWADCRRGPADAFGRAT